MARYEKILNSWKHGSQEAQREQVMSVCNHFFQHASYGGSGTKGSHNIKIEDEGLADFPGSHPRGEMTIPITGGQRVKKYYLKRIIEAVEHIKAKKSQKENLDNETEAREEA